MYVPIHSKCLNTSGGTGGTERDGHAAQKEVMSFVDGDLYKFVT